MLKKIKRLKSRSQFEEVRKGSRIVWGKFFGFAYISNKSEVKVGFIATKKAFKNAVDRNRFKRRLSQVVTELKIIEKKPTTWMVFVAKSNFLVARKEEIKDEVSSLTNFGNL